MHAEGEYSGELVSPYASMVELVDTTELRSVSLLGSVSSSLTRGTKPKNISTMVFNFYPHLPHDYEKYEDICPPMHQSMRVINKRTKKPRHGWKYHSHFNNECWNYISKTLDNSVGKKFDAVYSDICKKFSKDKDYEFRQEFLSRINLNGPTSNICSRSSYYLDEDKIIRSYEEKRHNKPRKEIILGKKGEKAFYYINRETFFKYPMVLNRVRQKLGNSTLFDILNLDKVSQKEGRNIVSVVSDFLYDNYGYSKWGPRNLKISEFIREVVESTYETCEAGSKKHLQFLAESKDAKRKDRRNYKKFKEEEASELLYRIELKRKLAKLQLNEVTRDRLGFDEESFKGEFYHGQKRKKKA